MRAIFLCLSLLVSGALQAQDAWPSKPVRLIVPSSPGGGTDVYARLLAQGLSDGLKQSFLVDNRPGASGNIGAAAAAKSAPDGYTFLVSANPALSVNPSLYPDLPYNAERDFTPVTRGVMAPMVLVVHPSQSKSLAELVATGKSQPGKLAFGSAGTGSPTFLGVRMLEENSGAKFTHVPYKGVGAGYADLLGGQIQFMFPDVASALSHIQAAKLRALAVTQATPLLPGVPTLDMAGFALEVFTSFSVVAPAGTPAPVVGRMAAEITRAMRSPSIAEKLNAQVLVPVFDTPEQFAASLKKERDGWAAFIRRNAIQPNQ
ncbi:MAG: tripartite tricarboxylate transporter substrate binding protein [Betaproteobacteria bacterium]|nr:tripartite tricarboxylate transporter substrate binding protein [Betaproteobacteria bacterium]MSQ87944.1 tripartite tricarboxylate transporter substrate binding protein [Betaproteobacteria bacterium]